MENAVGFICFFGIVMFTLEFFSLFFRHSRAEVSTVSSINKIAFVGQPAEVQFSLKNPSLKRGEFILYPITSLISFDAFYNNREPGEEKRNRVDQMLKYYRWMWLRAQFKEPFEETTGVVKNALLVMSPTFKLRGEWPLTNMRAHLSGVFGLLERSLKTKGDRGSILVAPRVLPVNLHLYEGAGSEQVDSFETRHEAGESQEFFSLREYQAGDSWRKVNWKAMARTNKVMIQETEQAGIPSYQIHLKTDQLSLVEFEEALVVSASLISHFVTLQAPTFFLLEHGRKAQFNLETEKDEAYAWLARLKRKRPLFSDRLLSSPPKLSHSFCIHHPKASEKSQSYQVIDLEIEGKVLNGIPIDNEISVSL